MTTPETTSEATAPPDETTSERLGHLESAVERIEQALARVLPGSHAEAQKRTENRLDRGSEMEEIARAAVEQGRREEEAKAAAEREHAERESDRERIARLEEKPPAPPRSRKTAALGWGDGRS